MLPFFYKKYSNSKFATFVSIVGSFLGAAGILSAIGAVMEKELEISDALLVAAGGLFLAVILNAAAKGISNSKTKKQMKNAAGYNSSSASNAGSTAYSSSNAGSTAYSSSNTSSATYSSNRAGNTSQSAAGVEGYLREAESFRKVGNFQSEVSVLTKAAKQEPLNDNVWNLLGRAYRNNGSVPMAIECYEKAITINPNAGVYYCNIGAAYMSRNELAKAVSHYELGLRKMSANDPAYAISVGNYAMALARSGDRSKALRYLQEAERCGYQNAHVIRKELGM